MAVVMRTRVVWLAVSVSAWAQEKELAQEHPIQVEDAFFRPKTGRKIARV